MNLIKKYKFYILGILILVVIGYFAFNYKVFLATAPEIDANRTNVSLPVSTPTPTVKKWQALYLFSR